MASRGAGGVRGARGRGRHPAFPRGVGGYVSTPRTTSPIVTGITEKSLIPTTTKTTVTATTTTISLARGGRGGIIDND